MFEHLISLNTETDGTLQTQLRRELLKGIYNGFYSADTRFPSSRKLSEQLGISRNTVALVYDSLIDEGFLVSHPRRGTFLSPEINQRQLLSQKKNLGSNSEVDWSNACAIDLSSAASPAYPKNWFNYRYPLIDGPFEASLFPTKTWRESSEKTLEADTIQQWIGGFDVEDDDALLQQIRTVLLPLLNIQAQTEEILLTLGSQHSMWLVNQLLVTAGSSVAVEEPCCPELRSQLDTCGANTQHFYVNDNGLDLQAVNSETNVLFVSPDYQMPSGTTMALAQRQALVERAHEQDFIIVEDNNKFSLYGSQSQSPTSSIMSLDQHGRTIYLSDFSKIIAPGLRLGFIVAPKDFIDRARLLRRQSVYQMPSNNQKAAAYFLQMGYFEVSQKYIQSELLVRWEKLTSAISYYFPNDLWTTFESKNFIVAMTGPDDFNANVFIAEAAKEGLLVESVGRYYAHKKPENSFRIGISSIRTQDIRPAIKLLAEVFWQVQGRQQRQLDNTVVILDEIQIAAYLVQQELIGRTLFGEPYRININADGSLQGWAGYDELDVDVGRWWIADGLWHRQWEKWTYGEHNAYQVGLDDGVIKWFKNGFLVDSCFLAAPKKIISNKP
jgi:GntR family transcriptional regulator/MocR family aminotransferase